MNDHTNPSGPSRREFSAGALALLAGAPLGAAAPEAAEPDPLAAATDALAAAAKARFGKYLTAEQFAEVEKAIRFGVARAELMKQTPLANGDEPAFAFRADVP